MTPDAMLMFHPRAPAAEHTPAETGPPTPHQLQTKLQAVERVWLMLLRKEVIQPHLPVRLPCYDFVPIASPTFDSSPPYGLGHRLRVLPTFMT